MTDLVTMTLTFRYRRFSFNQVTRVESVRQIRVSLRLFYELLGFFILAFLVTCAVSCVLDLK